MLLSLIFLVWNYQRLLMFMLKSFFVRFLVLGFWIENIVMLQVLFFILRFMLLNFLILCLMVLNQVLSFLKVFELQIIMQVLLFMLKMRVLFFMVFFLLRMSVQVLFIVGGLFMLLVVMYWRNFRVFLLWKMNLFMWEILKMLMLFLMVRCFFFMLEYQMGIFQLVNFLIFLVCFLCQLNM